MKRPREDEGPSSAEAESSASASAPATPVLYSYWRSSCSWRVRLALELKGIEFEYRAVNLIKDGGEQLKPEYASLNPMKEVPTLVIDGATLTQSLAIVEYLEEARPETPLLPRDPLARAHVRALCAIVAADTQPVQNLRVLGYFASHLDPAERDAKKTAWAKHWIENGLRGFEELAAPRAGRYCLGDEVTLADVFLVPQIYNAQRFGVDLEPFPTIRRVCDALADLPAFQRAHPSKQPDAPPA